MTKGAIFANGTWSSPRELFPLIFFANLEFAVAAVQLVEGLLELFRIILVSFSGFGVLRG